jgi:uncharacterized membrane protein YeaQ/YmgE (transglycosylase-associated protein family)
MDVNALLLTLLIGAVAGWFAGQLLQGTGFGLLGDIFVSIVEALIDDALFPTMGLNLGGDIITTIMAATWGQLSALIVRLIRQALAAVAKCVSERMGLAHCRA